ncbi:TPA: beta-galactosidase [Enterococcus faecium]
MKKLKRFLYGGDYNPNQWGKNIWKEDMRIFKNASINSATINVFSWAKIQPSEKEYYFEELDEIVDMLSNEGYDIVLGTSTASLPAWMFKKYPEVGRVDFYGRRHRFGQRHNACPNSLVYQKYASDLVEKLADRYAGNANITVWHVNNEYGGECYCENCEKAFRVWLKEKYKTIDKLNKAWNLEFWGHTVYDWEEIVVPNILGDAINENKTAFAGLSIDYCRFNSDSMLENFKLEKRAIQKYDSDTLITTNLMGTYKSLDYFKWAKEMDIVSWDNYPKYNTPWSFVAMTHDLMRGLKKQPFMLMEQTPSQQNWQPYNSLKKPGQMRAQSYQTIAHGADTIQFFQLRRSVGGCEKFHGAVIEHVGTENTRVFNEVAKLGLELKKIGNEFLEADNISDVGIIFDWDNYWALEFTSGPNKDLKYVDQIHQYYRYFYNRNISVDMIPFDADFSKYKIVVAPVLYMIKENIAEKLESFVSNGGTFITTFMSGIVDQSDNVILGGYPGPLRKLTGIWSEEIDALAPEQKNKIKFIDGFEGTTELLSDILHLETAESLGSYTDNFYRGMSFATVNSFGKGKSYYIGAQLDSFSLNKIMDQVCDESHIQPILEEETALEVTSRQKGDSKYYFIINFTNEVHHLPKKFIGKINILNDTIIDKSLRANPYDVFIIKET